LGGIAYLRVCPCQLVIQNDSISKQANVLVLFGDIQKRRSSKVVGGVEAYKLRSYRRLQQLHGRLVPVLRSLPQRRPTVIILRVRVRLAGVK